MKIEKSRLTQNALRTCAISLAIGLVWVSSVKAATANIPASATIVPPIAMAEPSDLRFSAFVAGATPGTVTLGVPSVLPEIAPTSATPITSGDRRRAGGVKLVGGTNCLALDDCGVGALQIGGPVSGAFNGVSILPTTTLTSGDNTLTLERIELRYGANGTAGAARGPGILNADGTGMIIIGGVLNVAAGQAGGTYAGSLTVSVDY